jgi:mannose-1-phosphate guanylyltransferase
LFKTEYPNEVAEFFLVNTNFLFGPGIFSWNNDEYTQKIKALSNTMEKILDLPKGSFKLLDFFKVI